MPPKRKRGLSASEVTGAAAGVTRRATRQTPVPVPLPLISKTPIPVPVVPASASSVVSKRVRSRPPVVAGTPAAPPQPTPEQGNEEPPLLSCSVNLSVAVQDGERQSQNAPAPDPARAGDAAKSEMTMRTLPPQNRPPTTTLKPNDLIPQTPRIEKPPQAAIVSKLPSPLPGTRGVADRNIDKVVLGDIYFRTWYPSYYGKEILGDVSANDRMASKDGAKDRGSKASSRRDREKRRTLERLYVCASCFKYAKELLAWRGHVRLCERRRHVPGKKIYVHPHGRRRILVAQENKGRGPGPPKRRRGDGGVRYVEEVVQDEGEWSIWEVDGEQERLFCQNLSLFAKLFLENKSVFFDVSGFKYYLLVYTSPPLAQPPPAEAASPPPQILGFFSKEKMSWDNNNLACILVFPPWQRKGLGALLMGASYEIARREGIMGGPEKPISDLGKKGYRRFWSGEIARWLLSRTLGDGDGAGEAMVDMDDISSGTWIAPEDCLSALRDMNLVQDAGMGPGKPEKKDVDDIGAELVDGEETPAGTTASQGLQQQTLAPPKTQPNRASSEPVHSLDQNGAGGRTVARVRLDKEAVRHFVVTQRISLEAACDPDGFVEGFPQVPAEGAGVGQDGAKMAATTCHGGGDGG